MFVKLSRDRAVTLEDRNNFRAFKVVIEDDPEQLALARLALMNVAELEDRVVAWVSQDALRQRPEVAGDTAWEEGFEAMIEKARPHGWIDDARKAIKAHIEWVKPE